MEITRMRAGPKLTKTGNLLKVLEQAIHFT